MVGCELLLWCLGSRRACTRSRRGRFHSRPLCIYDTDGVPLSAEGGGVQNETMCVCLAVFEQQPCHMDLSRS